MRTHVRNSRIKRARMMSFLRRMRTPGGRKILSQKRRLHKPKQRRRLLRIKRKRLARK